MTSIPLWHEKDTELRRSKPDKNSGTFINWSISVNPRQSRVWSRN